MKRTTPPQAQFDFLLASISKSSPPMDRIAAARVIEHSELNEGQLSRLAGALRNVNPMELSTLLKPFQGCSAKTGDVLIDSLSQSEAKSALRSDTFEPLLESFAPSVREKGEALLSSINVGEQEKRQKLDRLEKLVAKGDGKRGHLIYNSQKAACSLCHSIGYVGGTMGPDLTRIGKIRTERDLLEAIVYPSSNFVRSYEPVTLKTKTGNTLYGILKEASLGHVTLVPAPGDERRIAKTDIAEIEPGPVSLMPPGLDAVLSHQELGDLVVFLKSLQ